MTNHPLIVSQAFPLAQQRCFNHAMREAAARCPQCSHFYCRECVTEHEGRVICAACLAKLARTPFARHRGLIAAWRVLQLLSGVFVIWLFFYWLGTALLSLPSSFHEGSIWQGKWLEEP